MPLDREKARHVLLEALPADPKWGVWVDGILDRLEACVTPRLAEVDVRLVGEAEAKLARIRALRDVAEDEPSGWVDGEPLAVARHIREVLAEPAPDAPPAGVTLTPEEAALARAWYTRLPIGVTPEDVALAQRFDART